MLDAPVVFRDRVGHVWRPQNDDGNFAGPMRLREALVQSRNLVSVRLLDAIGVDFARKYISHFGFTIDQLPPNLSMSLGTASLPPLVVARGYAVFANGGFLVDAVFHRRASSDRDGKVVFKENPPRACRGCGSAATRQPRGRHRRRRLRPRRRAGAAPASRATVAEAAPKPREAAAGTQRSRRARSTSASPSRSCR